MIEDFGLYEGISEIILATISDKGIPNAAPIGLHKKGNLLFARIFNSTTLNNIIKTQIASANIVDNPILFVESALSKIDNDKFEYVGNIPVLKDCNGYILFDCKFNIGKNISLIKFYPIGDKIIKKTIKPVSRGFNAVIEACVHGTRYVVLKDEKYLKYIKYYDNIVKKCGGIDEIKAMNLLKKLICHQERAITK